MYPCTLTITDMHGNPIDALTAHSANEAIDMTTIAFSNNKLVFKDGEEIYCPSQLK